MSEIANLWLFLLLLGKVAFYTGLGPAIAIAFLFEKFGTGALRPAQSESGQIRGSNPRVVSDFLSASSISTSGGGQLALLNDRTLPMKLRATSPPRKEWRQA